MSGRPKRTQAEEDADALRVLIREAHEALKDLKVTIREAKEAREELASMAAVAVSESIDMAVKQGLETYALAIEKAIDNATDAVYARFDVIAATLLGETEQDKRKGEPTMGDLAHLVRRVITGVNPDELTEVEKRNIDRIAERRLGPDQRPGKGFVK